MPVNDNLLQDAMPDVLYHYCSTEAFISMISTKTVWLSSLLSSNDSMEGRLVRQAIARVAQKDNLGGYFLSRINELVQQVEEIFDGLGFCLSENGDLLGQWRGYADNGQGISIGFSVPYLQKLSEMGDRTADGWRQRTGFKLDRVEYSLETHEALVEPAYRKVREAIDAGAFRMPPPVTILSDPDEVEAARIETLKHNARAVLPLMGLFGFLFRLKAPSFSEEREWRLISYLVGTSDTCAYRATRQQIVPYRVVGLLDAGVAPITHVVLGPKNYTSVEVAQAALARYGFTDVKVARSAVTYR